MAHGNWSTERGVTVPKIASETSVGSTGRQEKTGMSISLTILLGLGFGAWVFIFVLLCCDFKTGPHHVALAGLELTVWTGFCFFLCHCGGPMVIYGVM